MERGIQLCGSVKQAPYPETAKEITGKPLFNYWWPVKWNGQQVEQFRRLADPDICTKFKEDFSGWGKASGICFPSLRPQRYLAAY